MPPNPPVIWRAAIAWPRMARQPRIIDRRRRARRAASRARSAVAALALDAHEQRAHAAQQQPRLDRTEHGALVVAQLRERGPRVVVRRGDERAGEHVGVAAEILRRRVHHEIGAERERPRVDRRRARRVDCEPRAARVRELGDRGDVGDVPRRVRRRLDPDEPASTPSARRAPRRDRSCRRSRRGRPSAPRTARASRAARSSRRAARSRDRRARAARETPTVAAAMPDAKDQRRRAALERREQLLGVHRRRVLVARVVAAVDELVAARRARTSSRGGSAATVAPVAASIAWSACAASVSGRRPGSASFRHHEPVARHDLAALRRADEVGELVRAVGLGRRCRTPRDPARADRRATDRSAATCRRRSRPRATARRSPRRRRAVLRELHRRLRCSRRT